MSFLKSRIGRPSSHTNDDLEKKAKQTPFTEDSVSISSLQTAVDEQLSRRKLKNRHIQLIGIGGTIGTALFVAIGTALLKGGPGSLFLGFALWCIPILFITTTVAEMVCYLPINSPFIRLSGRCCEEAVEVMAGWNFFILEAVLIPFEITAVNTILHFWVTGYSPAITISIQLVLYFLINYFTVSWYGESEFWLSLGKVILATGLIIFTFIVMIGGNPHHDKFGFRYWNDPGAFKEYISTGDWGRFLGFFACIIQASYTIAGPEYVSMTAGECENPTANLPKAFKAVFYRLTFFFVLGALAVGILCPSNDEELTAAFDNSLPGAAASPYVVAMTRLDIKILPHIVNGLILTACFSAGNSYTYCASRSLYGLALDGHAPKILRKQVRGVPIYCVLIALAFGLLSFLQLNNSSAVVLNWLVNMITASQLINYCVLCTTYLCFYRALKAQGIDRKTLPFRGWFQPYLAIFSLICVFCMTWLAGYTVFVPGNWDVQTFLFSYIMIFIDIFIYISWKLIKRPKWKKPAEIDITTGKELIDEYEKAYLNLQETMDLNGEIHKKKKPIYDKVLDFLFT